MKKEILYKRAKTGKIVYYKYGQKVPLFLKKQGK